ncbi:MAG: ExeM/NucH family extracellular endonuclease, partial [Synechocystis sp.]
MSNLIITGVIDGPLSGGTPKAIELYALADIADLSIYGIEAANNGAASTGSEFTLSGSATAGQYLYIASEDINFNTFFGFNPTFVDGVANINGDDAIILFENGAIVDVFGEVGVDGTGTAWEHLDGWAYRNNGATPNSTFNASEWTFSGVNALDDDAANINTTATPPWPIGTFGGGGNPSAGLVPPVVNNFDEANDVTGWQSISVDADTDNTFAVSTQFSNAEANGFGDTAPANDWLISPGVNLNGTENEIVSFETQTRFTDSGVTYPQLSFLYSTDYSGSGDPTTATWIPLTFTPSPENSDQFTESGNIDISGITGTNVYFAFQYQSSGTEGGTAARWRVDSFNLQVDTLPPDPIAVKINEIQGSGTESPLIDQIVTIEAIVVGDFQDGDGDASRNLRGFYVQEEDVDADGDALTSEGIFIFEGGDTTVDVNVGDKVQITGTVGEFFGETQLDTLTNITVISAGNPLPTAAAITLPAAATSLAQDGDVQPDLEAFEGMLVNFTDTLTVTEMFNLDRFNEIKLVQGDRPLQFTQNNDPDVAGFAAHLEEVGARTITYDDGLNQQNALIGNLDGFGPTFNTASNIRMGDTITGLSGVLSYQWAGNSSSQATWRVRSTQEGENTFTKVNDRPVDPDPVGGSLKVTGFNVLNYFTTIDLTDATTANGNDPRGADTAEEFARQTDKLVTALLAIDADVLGLAELENDFLPGSTGNAIEYLVNALNAVAGAGTYDWVNPGNQFVGDDAIAVGLIYKPSAVGLVGDVAILDTPDFLDPNNTGENRNRPAVAQSFQDLATGETFTAVVNHLKSNGCSGLTGGDASNLDSDQGDGQGFWNDTRTKAAQELVTWLNTNPTGVNDSDYLLLGDFNAYAQEDPVKALQDAGYVNLASQFGGETTTSYVFDGQVGTLDYAFASASLLGQVTGATEWGINSDEADALDYNLDFGRDAAIFDGTVPFRSSDHDPVIVGLNLLSTLPNGVASGDVDQDSAVLWTRSTVLGEVMFEYATDANFNNIVGSVTETVNDANLPVKTEIEGLTAGTEYFYRVTDAQGSQEVGRFVTAAAPGTSTGLTFGVSGDWRGEVTPYPAIRNIPDQNLDFFVALGDTVYADDRSPILDKDQAETVEDFRLKHQEVYGSRFGENFWASARASTSILSTIDDHEVTNDFQGGATADTDARFPETTGLINDTAIFENGLQVYQEYNPLRDEFYDAPGNDLFDGERKLYRFNTYGDDAAVITLDTRSFRDQNLPVPNPTDLNAVVTSYATSLLTPDRTLLGDVQLEALKADLLAADGNGITWKFIMIPEPIQNILVGVNTDNYEGFAQERAQLLQFIDENNIENVVFVAADIHITTVNNLTYQVGGIDSEQRATSIFEITTGSVAYDAPSGVAFAQGIAALSPNPAEALALYNSLPIAPDTDDVVNDKDDFVKTGFNGVYAQFPQPFDPIGLNNNLPQAEGLIDAQLLQGDYFVSHSYSWTEFDIDPTTQALTVTTYGIDGYTEENVEPNNPDNKLDEVLASQPTILSQFQVNPNVAPEVANQRFTLPGDSAVGTVVGTIAATDANTGHTEQLTYAIEDSTGFFAVDAATGQITLVDNTGLEGNNSGEFTFETTVSDPTGLVGTASITV